MIRSLGNSLGKVLDLRRWSRRDYFFVQWHAWLGSGKSLHATERIIKRLKRGLPVITNFSLDREKIPHPELYTYLDNDDLRPQALVDYARGWFRTHRFGEDKILVVIDECQ